MLKLGRLAMAVVLVGVTLGLSRAATAQVLDQVPRNALVVFKVNNLEQTSGKLSKFVQDLGVGMLAPQLADPLGTLQEKMQVHKGLDKGGEMAFAYIDPQDAGGDDRSMLILIPVTSYDEFLSNFADAKTEAGISTVTLPDDDEPVYLANWGKYAVLSPVKNLVSKKPEGIKPQGLAAKELQTADAALYVDFTTVRVKLEPKLKEGREELLKMIDEGAAKGDKVDAKYIPLIKAICNQAINVADGFLQEAQAATFAIRFTKEGVATKTLVEFEPNSYMGQKLAAIKNTDATLTSGLPDGKYLVVGGGVNSPVGMDLVNDFLAPIEKELPVLGDDAKGIESYLSAIRMMQKAEQGASFGMVAPAGQLRQESIVQGITVMNGDAKSMATAQKQMFQSQQDFMKLIHEVTNNEKADPVKTTFTPAAKTLDGVTFDQFQTQFDFGNDSPQQMQAKQMVDMLYGPNGLNALSGVVDEGHFINAISVSDAVLSQTIASVKANQDAVGKMEAIQAVAAELPKMRVAAIYVPVDNIISTGLAYAGQMGMRVPVQLPPNLPPIGFSAGTEGSAMEFNSYVPSQLVQSLIAAGMQAFMAMQRTGGPAGGGGL